MNDQLFFDTYDVIIVGGGNAALTAALSAQESGAKVLVLERAPKEERGGNSYFTGGAFRFAYNGLDDIKQIIPDLTPEEEMSIEVGSYTEEQFFNDILKVTEYMTDPVLADYLVSQSFETMKWMRQQGIRFTLMFGRQAFKVDGKFRFWGGLIVEAVGAGVGLVDMLYQACERRGISVAYASRALRIVCEPGTKTIRGIEIEHRGQLIEIKGRSVVLASGGFESNPAMRAQYLGPGWDLAKVRGTPFNTGDGIRMALEMGAEPYGHWSGCHAVAWDYNAPMYGDRKIADLFQKHSYPLGIIVNKLGKRFVDEGADFRNYTYAKYGREILKQPERIAFQIFDQKVSPLLRDEYRIREVTKETADTLPELARKLGIDVDAFVQTVEEFNASVQADVPFNPAVKDGRGTVGIFPPKSNWAQPIDTPPYVGYAVTCGITFTFGGVHVTTNAEVLDQAGRPIPGLFSCGEMVGGLFYHNYPGGTGLMSGAVFGRIAGRSAAEFAQSKRS